MALQLKNGKLLLVGGKLANHADCCGECDCCYDDRTSIELYNLTGNFASWNGSYSLAPDASGNCLSTYGGIGSVGCSPPPPSDSYHVESIFVGTSSTSAASQFNVQIVLQKCDTLGFKTRVNYFSNNLICGQVAGNAAANSPPAGFPALVPWRNLV